MAFTGGFYNSINNDRKYDAVQMGEIFDGVIGDGVYATIGTALMVKAGTDMNIIVGTGRAWFNETWSKNDSPLTIAVSQSELILDRIDAVVLRINKTDEVRANSIEIVKGTPASENPQKPELSKTNGVFEYPLAYILVKRGATEIVQSDITNTVGTSECPFVTGVLETINIDGLIAKWQDEWNRWLNLTVIEFEKNRQQEFDRWFDTVRDQLSQDAAGNLQNQIYNLYDKNEFFGELVLTKSDYESSLTSKLNEHIQTQSERASRKGDQVIVICEELDKREIWLCDRVGSNNTWKFFSSNAMVYPAKFVETVIYASKWVENEYSFEDDYPSDQYDLNVYLSNTCTKDQIDEWSYGYIVGNQSINKLKSVAATPKIDIPVMLKVVRK